jgi:hypothetical protein
MRQNLQSSRNMSLNLLTALQARGKDNELFKWADTRVRRWGVFILLCIIAMGFGLRTANQASVRANQASGPEKPEFAGRIGAVVQDPYQPKRARMVPEVLPDPSRHSSVDHGSCLLPGDVRGAVRLAVYRVCSNVDVALVHDPVPQGNISPDRPAK